VVTASWDSLGDRSVLQQCELGYEEAGSTGSREMEHEKYVTGTETVKKETRNGINANTGSRTLISG
jgi:hypothetical protein